MQRHKAKKSTKKETIRNQAEHKNTNISNYITYYQTPEAIVKIILDKIINSSIRLSGINRINKQLKHYCFQYIQNQIEPLFEENYINYTLINNKNNKLFWKNKKQPKNEWIEIKEPETPKDDRFEGVFIHLKEIDLKNKKFKVEKIKEGLETDILINNNDDENSLKGKKPQNLKKIIINENKEGKENKNKEEENNTINKAKTTIQSQTYQPSKGNKKMQILDFPSIDIPDIEKEFIHDVYDPPNIDKLRKEREEEIKKKEREAKLKSEEIKLVKKKDDFDKINKKQKQLDSNKFTFDSNGKIISFRQYKLDNLTRDFQFIKNTIKENNDPTKTSKKKKLSFKDKNIKLIEEIIKNPAEEEKAEKIDKILDKNKDKIIPSGSNFQIMLPNIGVVIKENQKIKEGGREFNKFFNKYSINDYDKILNEYVPLQNKTKMKNKMEKMSLTASNSNKMIQKKMSESVDNQRNNTQNNYNNKASFNYNTFNSNDNLNTNNPLLTTNDNIPLNINDIDSNIINNTSSYLKTSIGVNSFSKNNNNYNPLMTSFNLRTAVINLSQGKRGISFNDSITMKKAGASSLKMEIDSLADLRNDKTYYGPENLKQKNIFGRYFMKNYKIGLFKPPNNNILTKFNKNILSDTNWGNKHTEKGQKQENIVFAKHHTKQQALRELGSNILNGIKVKLPRDRKVEINNK